jgi:hypothetical protein
MSAHPFETTDNTSRWAEAEQLAAIEAMRAKMLMGKRPMVTLPFGKQQPLDKYVGVRILPFVKNPFVSDPSVLLKDPDPTAHYGFAKRDDNETRGKIRKGTYEAVYVDELKDDNDAAIGISEEILTERGPNRLVIWSGLQLVKIPYKTWLTEYEEPALMSAARLAMHQQSFEDFSMQSVHTQHATDQAGVDIATHSSGGNYSEMRGKVQTSMTVEA